MSEPSDKNYTQHFLEVKTKSDRGLAEVMFNKRPGLKHVFETAFSIQFPQRTAYGDKIFFTADSEDAANAQKAFATLSGVYSQGGYINKEIIRGVANDMNSKEIQPTPASTPLADNFSAKAANQNASAQPAKANGGFTPKNPSQAALSETIDNSILTFAIGSAGTGKTYVAVAKAVEALKAGKVKKILLARPAQAAGEDLGYLKGDANEKLAPYMRPLYDELEKTFGRNYQNMLTNGTIEIVPVGFMRGRTFTDSFIILDEAQNTSVEQIKMALTRIGERSKMVVTGDEDQIDLKDRDKSGLIYAATRLYGKQDVGVHKFGPSDIVRPKIVMTVVEALGEENQAPKPLPEAYSSTFQPTVAAEAKPEVTADATPAAQTNKPQQKQGGTNPRWKR
ncbi:MAG: PhoH family protein [Micavibrio sp.]|nr:PhoH family protein [Micavibrio sp.]